MVGHSTICGLKEQETVIVLRWDTKGRKKHGYKINSLKLYLDENTFYELNETSKMKLEVLIGEIYRLNKLKKIKSELDLTILINGFMMEHNPAILFNRRKHFTFEYSPNDDDFREVSFLNTFTLLDDKYFKEKYNRLRKRLMKDTIKRRD